MTGSEGTPNTQDGPTRTGRVCNQRLGTYGIYCGLIRGHAGDHSSGRGDEAMTWGDDMSGDDRG